MQRKLIKFSSLFLLLVMLFMLSSFTAMAESERVTPQVANLSKKYLSVAGVKSNTLDSYAAMSVSINGRAAGYSARLISETVYIPIWSFVRSVTSASISYNSSSATLSVIGDGHSISVSLGAYVLYASGRPIFSMMPAVILSDGNMYVPADSLAKAFGVSIKASGENSVAVSGKASPLLSADSYYREDEVYWLARIINAESRGEPLLGQIAVGNVVLNRVRSSEYPNTIWGVIFDKKYGVQFSPILDGSIYNEPGYTSILAAKICLEGFSVSDESLFFLYPGASTSSWIPNTREYVFSIGKHDFYK